MQSELEKRRFSSALATFPHICQTSLQLFPIKKLLLPGKAGGQAGRRAIKKMSDSARSWTASKLFYFKLRDIREGPFFKSSNSENASRNKKKRDTTSNRILGLKKEKDLLGHFYIIKPHYEIY